MEPQILQSILRALPEQFVYDIPRCIETSYWEAHTESFNNPLLGEEASYHYPYYRRSILEKKMRDAALDAGLRAERKSTPSGHYHYTEIHAKDWVFTVKHAYNKYHMPQSSTFRQQGSRLNCQLQQLIMPSILGIEESVESSKFYAIIHHGADCKDISKPGFIRIGVPLEDFSGWMACYNIHDLLENLAKTPTEEDIAVIATWKERAIRNIHQE